jgi:GTP cyclohydrolase I
MSFQKTKVDPDLGLKIHEYLKQRGVETPTSPDFLYKENKHKIDQLEQHFTEIWKIMGLDMSDDSLVDTPKRMAKMWVLETMWGLLPENFPKCTTVSNKMKYDEMIVEKNITVMSQCEHHGVVIDGTATVAYIPKDNVLGLSKINRVVEYFAKRPQIQERLTEQIYYALEYILDTNNIGVVIDAQHYCVKSRGVEDVGSSTVTSKLGGGFKTDPAVRNEFMNIFNSRNTTR